MSFEKATIANLVAFINRQPATRTIDHSSWETCAIAHFIEEELGLVPENPFDYIHTRIADQLTMECGSCNQMVRSWIYHTSTAKKWPKWSSSPTVMDVLNDTEFHNGATYGQLRTVMAEKFPELGFGQKPPIVTNKPAWFTEWSKKKFAELVG